MNAPDDGQSKWSPLQEAYVGKLMATYQANLHLFHEHFPDVFAALMAVDLPAPFDVDDQGQVAIYAGRFRGSYPEFVHLSSMLYRIFDDEERRPRIRINSEYLNDAYSISFHGDNPDFYRHVEPGVRRELIAEFEKGCGGEAGQRDEAYFGERKLPLALVFGTGIGWHIDRLVDDYEIRNLVIVDTDIARLNLSLYFLDYNALYQKFMRSGRMLLIGYYDDMGILAREVLMRLQKYYPPYFIQGAGIFFEDYDSAKVRQLWENLRKDMWMLFRGWGFLDDEVLGAKQAWENLVADVPLFRGTPENMPEQASAIVVGAGPSLDRLMPLLRAAKDKAVIICCGSAITSLAQAGLKPDFHLETERTRQTFRILDNPRLRGFLEDVPILASIIMVPDVYTLTPRPLMFCKELDLGSALGDFFGEYPRIRTNPTCTNAGVDLALKLGFKNVYLFGVDLGFIDESHHHARSSMYYDENDGKSHETQALVEQTHKIYSKNEPVPGNFREEVLATEDLIYSRDGMRLSVLAHPEARVFNLNDGARIGGTEPLAPEDFALPSDESIKAAALEATFSAFQSGHGALARRNLGMLVKQVEAIIEDLQRIVATPYADRLQAIDVLGDIHAYFSSDEHTSTQVFPLVRGAMLHMGRFTYDGIAHIKDEAAALRFAAAAFALFIKLVEGARDNLVSLESSAAADHATLSGETEYV